MSSTNAKQANINKKRKVSVGASDQKQNVKRVKIEQPNPTQKIQKNAKAVEPAQNNDNNKGPRRKIVSKLFEQYYKEFINNEEEWDLFVEVLSKKLPITFRINGPPTEKAELFKSVAEKKIFRGIKDIKIDGAPLSPPLSIPWYPNGLAYRFNINPSLLQTNASLKEMNEWLFSADMSGSINRQEEVSMIPPLLLDVNSTHRVLDLCSAPGSKTSQILGIMRDDASKIVEGPAKKVKDEDKEAQTESAVKSKYIKGMIVANDSNFKRCCVMSSMHDAALMITNYRGELFPATVGDFKVEFDRVLCDVPCSGDGTMRKLPARALAEWSSVDGLLLHRKQVEICQRGVDLLKADGRLVYSTCSMNPVENEAVVTEILRKNRDLELIDVKDELPGLLRRPGLSSWKIMSKKGKFYSSHAEYENDEDKDEEANVDNDADKMEDDNEEDEENEQKKPDRRRKPIILLPSMFPPKPEIAANMYLDRCLRIYPHLQDTGGFFVAVFKKKKMNAKIQPRQVPKNSVNIEQPDEDQNKKKHNKEKRFPNELSAVPEDQFLSLKKVFEITDDFPRNQLRVCKEELRNNQIRKIYFFSDAILPFVDALKSGSSTRDLTIINAGLIVFERTTKDFHIKHNFSLTVDSLLVFKQFMGAKRLMGLPNKDFTSLVSQRRLFYTDLTNKQNADSVKSLYTGYVVVTTRVKFGQRKQAQLAVLCRNGQGALTLCGNKWDLWPISFLGTTGGQPEAKTEKKLNANKKAGK